MAKLDLAVYVDNYIRWVALFLVALGVTGLASVVVIQLVKVFIEAFR